jgi:hypothetical protein
MNIVLYVITYNLLDFIKIILILFIHKFLLSHIMPVMKCYSFIEDGEDSITNAVQKILKTGDIP